MAVLNPSFVFSLEQNMRVIQENEYRRLVESGNLWWNKVAKVMPTKAGKEIVSWIIQNALLENTGVDPSVKYRDVAILNTSFTPEYLGAALKLQRAQLEDLDGNGIDIASDWVAQIGAQAAYFPQKSVAATILAGETSTAYDGINFFANNHPVNPKIASVGTFANLFTGAAASTPSTDPNDAVYPGALNVASATYDALFAGLQNIYSYIAAIKMPNGIDPRWLRPSALLCPTTIAPKMANVLNAQFISMASAGSGGGSMAIQGQLQKYGYGEVILAPELDSDPTSFYVVAEQMTSSQLGSIVYVDREPVGVRYFSGMGGDNSALSVLLARSDELEWIARGRATTGFGHPHYLFKVKAS